MSIRQRRSAILAINQHGGNKVGCLRREPKIRDPIVGLEPRMVRMYTFLAAQNFPEQSQNITG